MENINADGIDLDYSIGKINNFSCKTCFNDAIDISNTTLYLENFKAADVYDKALSIGEYSKLYAEDLEIQNANIGLAVKDGSFAKVKNILIKSTKFPITTYIKKKEFGPAKIELKTVLLEENLNPIFIEDGTEFKIEEETINKLIKKIFIILYIQMQNTEIVSENLIKLILEMKKILFNQSENYLINFLNFLTLRRYIIRDKLIAYILKLKIFLI